MRSLRWMLLCALVFVLVVLPVRPAVASNDFLPEPPSAMVDWVKAPLYDRYPVWNYTYGGVKTFPETIGRLYYLINLMQVGKAWTVKLGIRSVEYALYFDAISPVVTAARQSMSAVMDRGGWLVRAGLALTGAAALWQWAVRGRRSKAFRVLAGGAAILVGMYVIVAAAPSFLVAGAGAARGLGGEMLSGVAAVTAPSGAQGTPSERLVRAAGEGVWRSLVFDPWVEGEFSAGAAEKAAYLDEDVQGGKWLAMTPTARENWYLSRLDFATRLSDFGQYEERLVQDYLPRRFMLTLVSLLLGLVWTAAMLLLAGGVIYYQFVLLAMLGLAPLWAVLGLWHPSGLRVARGALMKAAGALVSQVVLLAVLALALGLTGPLLSLGNPLGWLAQAILVTLFAGVLCRYRFAWLRWGREEGAPGVLREVRTWRERFRSQRTVAAAAVAAGRDSVREVQVAVGDVLPQFRDVAAASSLAQRLEEKEQAASGALSTAEVSMELSDELRRLRLRLARGSGEVAEEAAAPGLLPSRGAVAAGGGASGAGGAGAGAAGAGAVPSRPKPEAGRRLNEYRKR